MSYVQRLIDLTISFGTGSYGSGTFENVKLSGLRVSATIEKTGIPGFSTAVVRVYGMTRSLMNRLSTLGRPAIYTRTNQILLEAGDVSGKVVVFQGIIQDAWADMQAAPEVFCNIVAFVGLQDQMKPVPPTSFPGNPDAAVIMSGLASQMGYTFENSGVSVILAQPYFPGTARMQAVACARAANIEMFIDDTNQTLAIWPKGSSRNGQIPLISKETGMVGYPAYSGGQQMRVATLYNPAIRFDGQVKVQSSITPANGGWTVNKITHRLDSMMPDGDWFTDLEGYHLGLAPSLPTD